MIEPDFGLMTPFDIALTIFMNQAICFVLFVAIWLTRSGYPKWIPRKIVHISMATAIALVVPQFSNLTSIAATIFFFLTWLSLLVLAGIKFKSDVLESGRRRDETPINTFLSPFVVMMGFAILLYFAGPRMEIFAAGALALGWGDGAGEIIGRLFGRHHYPGFCNPKTIEGTISVMLGTLTGLITSYAIYAPLRFSVFFWIDITIVSVIIGVAELFCVGWWDNFVIPVLTGILLLFLGI
ncbi:MAG: hypothetical protein ACTSW4_02660 [Candidatus Ranarchaeia archaeon]